MAEKTSTGRLIAAAGGIILIISLFLSWYGISAGGGTTSGIAIPEISNSFSGWASLDFADFLFLLIGLLAILPAALDVFDLELELPVEPGSVLTGLGIFAVLWVVLRIISKPGGGVSGFVDVGLKFGIFIALIGAALIAFGGFTQRGEEESPGYESAAAPVPAAAPPAQPAPPVAEPPAQTPPAAQPQQPPEFKNPVPED